MYFGNIGKITLALLLTLVPFVCKSESELCLDALHDSIAENADTTVLECAEIDTLHANIETSADTVRPLPAIWNKNVFMRWLRGLVFGNVDRTFERPIDFSIAFAPSYSQESSITLGVNFIGLYRINRQDSVMQPSNITILGTASINGTYRAGAEGNCHFSRDHRLKYYLVFKSQPRDFRGTTYYDCNRHSSDPIRMRNNHVVLDVDYQQRFSGHWFWGASLRMHYQQSEATPGVDNEVALRYLTDGNTGLRHSKQGFYMGIGPLLQYDSRDYILQPTRGIFLFTRFVYYPHFMGKNFEQGANISPFNKDVFNTTVQFNAYHKLWNTALLAYDVYTELNLSKGSVPWPLRQEINLSDTRMRGIYTGYYIDDNQMCAQVELRQHIYKRLGAVGFVGVGSMFHSFEDIRKGAVFLNYGAGLRLEFKHRTNVRLDAGFVDKNFAISLGIGETF